VLCLLLERPGELVTREELKQRLWPADTFVDFDDGLNTAVKKLRDALGDSAERPQFIETLQRRGYRFVGAVEQPMDVVESAPAPKRRRWIAIGLGLAFLVLATTALVYRNGPPAEVPPIRSIAVLPLENLSGEESQDYFAAGLTDALTTELARTLGKSLRVTSRTSAAKYKGKPLSEIARELDVDAVIEGSVVRSGNRARITANLINTRADKSIWAGSYEADLRDILSLQNQIAATVARQVQMKLSPQAEARLAARAQVDPKAYDLYQRGRYQAFSNNPADMKVAAGFLEEAVHLEPNLAPAHALLARLYTNQAFFEKPHEQQLDLKAIDEVNTALKLDPDLAEAYLARGLIYWTHRYGFPHERAIVELKHALELDPNLAEAHHWLGAIYLHIGLLDKSEREVRAAVELDPANMGVRYRMAINQLIQGKLEEAVAGLEGTKRYSPELWEYQMALALFKLGRKQEAAAQIGEYLQKNPADGGGVGNAMQALLHADAGQPELAMRSIQLSIEKGKDFGHFHHAAYTIGTAYALMKRPKEAVQWLRAAEEDGFPCYPFFAGDSALRNLQEDAAFLELMSAMRSDWERRMGTL
jgi:TolB-like protein